jgi:multidrug resistance efflux pump
MCEMAKQINQEKFEKWLVENLAQKVKEYNINIQKKNADKPKKALDEAKIREKLNRLKDLYISGLILRDMYEKDFTALTNLLAETHKEATEQRSPIDESHFEGFTELYENLTQNQRKALWSRLLERVVVTENGDYIVTFNQL